MAKESAALRFLYGTAAGRLLLRPLTAPGLSRAVGRWMDSRSSRVLIGRFVRKNGIDLSDYLPEDYASFNAFFTRRIRPELRPVDMAPDALVAPCDGLLTAYRIAPDVAFAIKGSRYTVRDLLGGDAAADPFAGGTCLVFRLCVDHYHRYCYFDDGEKGENHFLPGRLHTVRPIALAAGPVFVQNSREYTLLHTEHFGLCAQIEVGALLVGRIDNYHGAGHFARGEEKGRFLYGGSTVVLLLGPGAADIPQALFDAAARDEETPVRMGQAIGRAAAVTE
jgi:phosphatidylserine decarboxylase